MGNKEETERIGQRAYAHTHTSSALHCCGRWRRRRRRRRVMEKGCTLYGALARLSAVMACARRERATEGGTDHCLGEKWKEKDGDDPFSSANLLRETVFVLV